MLIPGVKIIRNISFVVVLAGGDLLRPKEIPEHVFGTIPGYFIRQEIP
jgi:hypothetical protein